MPDFLISRSRFVRLDRAGLPGAHVWLDENATSEPWQWRGGALSIEPRCAGDLIRTIEAAGFDISR
jgi:hypothetical protein